MKILAEDCDDDYSEHYYDGYGVLFSGDGDGAGDANGEGCGDSDIWGNGDGRSDHDNLTPYKWWKP